MNQSMKVGNKKNRNGNGNSSVLGGGVLGIIAVVVMGIGMIGCSDGGERDAAADGVLRMVATTGMVGDLVRAVGGDRVQVEDLMGSGVDPHQYKLSRTDVVKLESAAVIWYNGMRLEGKVEDTLERMGERGRRVVGLAEPVLKRAGLEDDPEAGKDPHLWMDVRLWRNALDVVAETLQELDPAGAEQFRDRAAAYGEQLDELDSYVRNIVKSLPEERRVLVTAHDAFGYFGRAYGVEVHGIQGLSTETEAGLQDMARLVGMIVARGLPAVFVESSVADKNVKALVEGAQARGHQIRIGGELFSDAMGPKGSYEGTYIGMIDHNATILVRALGGNAPERGMQGLLAEETAQR